MAFHTSALALAPETPGPCSQRQDTENQTIKKKKKSKTLKKELNEVETGKPPKKEFKLMTMTFSKNLGEGWMSIVTS